MPQARRTGVSGGLVLAAALALGAPAATSAESVLWTLAASPLVATSGVATTFTLTATNEDPLAALQSGSEIGCVILNVPANFSIASVGVTGSNAGGSWVASRVGNTVKVQAGSGGDRLALQQWVRFTVRATALNAGSLAWASTAYRDQGCSGTGALLGLPPIVVVTDPAVTPSPAPTPTPTPTPTLTPTPTPTPSASPPLPSLPLPSGSASPSASPGSSPGATASPTSSGSGGPGPSDGSPTPAAASSSPGGGDPESRLPSTRFDERRLELGGASVGIFAGVEIWAVPAATIALPGLLVLIWVALQAAGAIAWIPAVRRLRGEDGRPRRVRSRTAAP